MLPPQEILCSTDFSNPSYEGLKVAIELANISRQSGMHAVQSHDSNRR